MDNKLIVRLKEFYQLETFQVAFYKAQVDSAIDEYYAKAFNKLAQIEQGHVDYFAGLIEQAGESLPAKVGSIFKLAGHILGEAVESAGQQNTCKLGVLLENKALKHYKKFIAESKDKQYNVIRNTLIEYQLDEEFHTLWLRDYMNNH